MCNLNTYNTDSYDIEAIIREVEELEEIGEYLVEFEETGEYLEEREEFEESEDWKEGYYGFWWVHRGIEKNRRNWN